MSVVSLNQGDLFRALLMYEIAREAKPQSSPHSVMIIIGSKRPEADVRMSLNVRDDSNFYGVKAHCPNFRYWPIIVAHK